MSDIVTIELTQIRCNDTSENPSDEVYLLIQMDDNKALRYPAEDYQSLQDGD